MSEPVTIPSAIEMEKELVEYGADESTLESILDGVRECKMQKFFRTTPGAITNEKVIDARISALRNAYLGFLTRQGIRIPLKLSSPKENYDGKNDGNCWFEEYEESMKAIGISDDRGLALFLPRYLGGTAKHCYHTLRWEVRSQYKLLRAVLLRECEEIDDGSLAGRPKQKVGERVGAFGFRVQEAVRRDPTLARAENALLDKTQQIQLKEGLLGDHFNKVKPSIGSQE